MAEPIMGGSGAGRGCAAAGETTSRAKTTAATVERMKNAMTELWHALRSRQVHQ
jgi:hypothetical protein